MEINQLNKDKSALTMNETRNLLAEEKTKAFIEGYIKRIKKYQGLLITVDEEIYKIWPIKAPR
jgi:hypothetical protein